MPTIQILFAGMARSYENRNLGGQREFGTFPDDFMFQLSTEEFEVTNCDHLAKLKYSTSLPYAFTEHGALMLQIQGRRQTG